MAKLLGKIFPRRWSPTFGSGKKPRTAARRNRSRRPLRSPH